MNFFREALSNAKMSILRNKYEYLYKYPNSEKFIAQEMPVFVVEKLSSSPNTTNSLRKPYRTLSHFGFNIPQIVVTPPQFSNPSNSENNFEDDDGSVHLSSQECNRSMNLEMKFISVKKIHIDEYEDCGASGESLAMPLKNRTTFDFVSDPESENTNAKIMNQLKPSSKRIYRNSSMSEEEDFEEPKALVSKPLNLENQCCHINVNIELVGLENSEFIDKQIYCEKIANLLQSELSKSNFKISVAECKQKILENIKDIENSLNELKLEE